LHRLGFGYQLVQGVRTEDLTAYNGMGAQFLIQKPVLRIWYVLHDLRSEEVNNMKVLKFGCNSKYTRENSICTLSAHQNTSCCLWYNISSHAATEWLDWVKLIVHHVKCYRVLS
jgi:hypothetical protein